MWYRRYDLRSNVFSPYFRPGARILEECGQSIPLTIEAEDSQTTEVVNNIAILPDADDNESTASLVEDDYRPLMKPDDEKQCKKHDLKHDEKQPSNLWQINSNEIYPTRTSEQCNSAENVSVLAYPPKNGHCIQESLDEIDSANDTDDSMELEALAPTFNILEKEVIEYGVDTSSLQKETQFVDNLIFLIVAFKFHDFLVTPLSLHSITSHASELPEQMRNALNRINADTLPSRIKVFALHFSEVFHLHDDLVSRHSNAENWLEISINGTLTDLLRDLVEMGKKTLSDLCTTLTKLLGVTYIPWLGQVSESNLKTFLVDCDNVFGISNDVVFLTPKLDNTSSNNLDQRSQKQVATFFKSFLKSSAIPYTELSLVLSRQHPDILAALMDRTPDGILMLLLQEGSFKCEQGLVLLKGFKVSVPEKPAMRVHQDSHKTQTELPSSPKKHYSPKLQTNVTVTDASDTTKTDAGICICSSGIVICVGKSRATFWCSQSETCRNIFVIARRSKTAVDGEVGRDFTTIFKEGDRIVFTHEIVSAEGWTIEYALHVQVVYEFNLCSSCLCPLKKTIYNFHNQAEINNGVPLPNKCTFFWNCKGTVIDMTNAKKGIVKCMLNKESDQFFLAYFTKSTWFVGFDQNSDEFANYLTIHQSVEIDIVLLDFWDSGTLTWFCLCLRKLSKTAQVTAANVLWNCTGKVISVQADRFLCSVDNCSVIDTRCLQVPTYAFAPFQNVYLSSEGKVVYGLTSDMLQKEEELTFDVVVGQPCTAIFLRKSKRPAIVGSSPLSNSSHVISDSKSSTFLKSSESISSDSGSKLSVPSSNLTSDSILTSTITKNVQVKKVGHSLQLLSTKCTKNSATYNECQEILNTFSELREIVPIKHLSRSSQPYKSEACVKLLRDSDCQTVSTGSILSALSPT